MPRLALSLLLFAAIVGVALGSPGQPLREEGLRLELWWLTLAPGSDALEPLAKGTQRCADHGLVLRLAAEVEGEATVLRRRSNGRCEASPDWRLRLSPGRPQDVNDRPWRADGAYGSERYAVLFADHPLLATDEERAWSSLACPGKLPLQPPRPLSTGTPPLPGGLRLRPPTGYRLLLETVTLAFAPCDHPEVAP